VSANPPTGAAVNDSDSLTIPATSVPSISLVKSADVASVSAEDDAINYSFEASNTGNVTLSAIVITDVPVGAVSCPVTVLAPGVSTTCTADAAYLTTQAQVDAGQVVNTANVSATPPSGPAVGASDTVTIPAAVDPSVSLVKSADVASVDVEDDPINYSFVVTNTGNVTLSSVAITDVPVGSITCPVTTLAPDASVTCTADAAYLTTLAQMDAGEVVNMATVLADPPVGPSVNATDNLTIPATAAPSISLVKSADAASVSAEDDPIAYSFLVANSGNVTLSAISITDVPVGAVSCPATTLAPGASTTCTADAAYLTTQTQIDAGQVNNTASVAADPPVGNAVSATDSVAVPAIASPAISLVKSADVPSVSAADDPIAYSFEVTNIGNVTLTSITVTDVPVGAITCPATTLAPGASTTCTADAPYLTTQAQVDAGDVVNTASVAGNPPSGQAVSATDSLTVPVPSGAQIAILKSSDVSSVNAQDDPINYSFEVTNVGNVTLSSVTVTDIPVGAVTCSATLLLPGAFTTCTADAAYLATQAQVDAGQVDNTATVTAIPPSGVAIDASDSLSIPAVSAASISLVKSADVARSRIPAM